MFGQSSLLLVDNTFDTKRQLFLDSIFLAAVSVSFSASFGYSFFMRTAFKEWAIVVDALARGEQILILRKGGLREGPNGFQVEHSEFLFFPTLFHQQRESVTDTAQKRFDEISRQFPPAGIVRLEYFARVEECRRLESLAVAERLRGQHIWRDTV